MKSRFLSIATLLVLFTVISATQPVFAQSPSVAPTPAAAAPAKVATTGSPRGAEVKRTSSETDLLAQPTEKNPPHASDTAPVAAPAAQRALTAAEIEEMKDGK